MEQGVEAWKMPRTQTVLKGLEKAGQTQAKVESPGASSSTTLGWSTGHLGEPRRTGEEQGETGDCFMGEAGKERGRDRSWYGKPDAAVKPAVDDPGAEGTTPTMGEDG